MRITGRVQEAVPSGVSVSAIRPAHRQPYGITNPVGRRMTRLLAAERIPIVEAHRCLGA